MKIEEAIKAMKNIAEYWTYKPTEVEAAKLAIETLEKQMSKKLICETVDKDGIEYEFEHYKCPNCKNILHQRYKKSREPMRYKQNYCTDCGQKLNWD